MSDKNAINPQHYKHTINGREIQVVDVMETFFKDDAHLAQAVKYLLRAGRKPESSYVQDLGKALWWIVRAIIFHSPDTVIDLPSTVSPKKVTIDGKTLQT